MNKPWIAAGWILAFVAGAAVQAWRDQHETPVKTETAGKPLYWVAPMDPGFRRDRPGKSPMGMDLVPVYEDDAAAAGDGEVRISAAVSNNLGVRTGVAAERIMPRALRSVGYVGFDEDKLEHVHLRVEGWIRQLGVTSNGDRVEQGALLFELYSPQLIQAQEELLIALADGGGTLVRAARAKLGALGLADGQIDRLQRTRRIIETVPFRARQQGYVSMLNVRQGMFVRPDTEIMSIGRLGTVWVIVEVFERQAAWLATGQPAQISVDAHPGRQWTGQVDYVYPELDPVTRTTRVRIRVANDDEALRPNMFATVRIETGADEPVLTVDRNAVIRSGRGDRVIQALDHGRFRPVPVQIGAFGEHWVEIRRGLAAGDRVVTSAQFLIDSESAVDSALLRMTADEGAEQAHAEQKRGHSPIPAEHAAEMQDTAVTHAVQPPADAAETEPDADHAAMPAGRDHGSPAR